MADAEEPDERIKAAQSLAAVHSLEMALEFRSPASTALVGGDMADVPLSKAHTARAMNLLWQDHAQRIACCREKEVREGRIQLGKHVMPFFMTTYGQKPSEGWSLWISLHGGGGAPKAINDQQWQNQQRLYRLQEGIYVAPRAPTNTWNLWHEPHIDDLFDRLIEDLIVLKGVNPNRVYVMGYSAGGDGVYQLAPRMADRWAAAGMMAGHPNDASPLPLRNIGFALQVGGLDAAYDRNQLARRRIEKLDELQREDPKGYAHYTKIFEKKGHWMDREDAKALPWMAEFVRNPIPDRVVWKQDDVTHNRFYWLALPKGVRPVTGAEVVAERKGQTIEILSADQMDRLLIRLDDRMVDLDQPVKVVYGDKVLFEGRVPRTIGTLANTLEERGDPLLTFCAEVEVALPKAPGADSADDWAKMKKIAPRGYVCGFTAKPPVLDGRIDEAAWQDAPWTEDFLDIEGIVKAKPEYRTRAKMLWDNDNLYIAAELEEPHVLATVARHDEVIFQDNDFEVFINPDGDNHNYYELELNARNTTWDLYLPRPYKDGGSAENAFELTGMKSGVHVKGTLNNPADRDEGWSVEIAIPWRSLSQHTRQFCPPREGDQWRANFSRVEWKYDVVDGRYVKRPNRPENNWVCSPQGIVDMHRPERWGYVQFTKKQPGAVAFVPDAKLPARDALMEVYHDQKSYHARHGRWAGDLDELEMKPGFGTEFAEPIKIRKTRNGFEAKLGVKMSHGTVRQLGVRQDSLLTESEKEDPLQAALDWAGDNRPELEKALRDVPADHREAMVFLISNMPERDLRTLSADFLLENVRLAYKVWEKAPWKKDIPKEIFLNEVLPYANITEQRDPWRKMFYQHFAPLVKDARTPSEAAVILNQKIFPLLKVRYSIYRPKADQSPSESIHAGLASCSGLSIMLIDACRAVGVPARFAGTIWADKSGNHSWVEIWDHGWHYTGAAEPSGNKLNEAWFTRKASETPRNDPLHAVYAVSFQRTSTLFPIGWGPAGDSKIFAVDVTDHYANKAAKAPADTIPVAFRVLDKPDGDRCAAALKVIDSTGKTVFEGTTKDEHYDANDHLIVYLPKDRDYQVEIRLDGKLIKEPFRSRKSDKPLTWCFK